MKQIGSLPNTGIATRRSSYPNTGSIRAQARYRQLANEKTRKGTSPNLKMKSKLRLTYREGLNSSSTQTCTDRSSCTRALVKASRRGTFHITLLEEVGKGTLRLSLASRLQSLSSIATLRIEGWPRLARSTQTKLSKTSPSRRLKLNKKLIANLKSELRSLQSSENGNRKSWRKSCNTRRNWPRMLGRISKFNNREPMRG
jgi:hypothetical protein